jgi:hypothetical protein
MKKLLQMAFFYGFFCMNLSAQQPNVKENTLTQQIYFENAVYQLDVEQIKVLDELSLQFADKKIALISVSATADQKGKQKANEVLASRRAEQVRDYLLKKGVPQDVVRIDKCEILPVGIHQNNRRANIVVQYAAQNTNNNLGKVMPNPIDKNITVVDVPTKPKVSTEEEMALESLESFFAYSAKKYEQKYKYNTKKGKAFQGKKGTVVHIPPDAFETLDGEEVVGEVNINLQEAHTYADMILQNLSTVSDSSQLETGGMVRITATNADGQPLRLKKGKELFVSLPNANANADGMLVFTGERDPHDNIDWATNGTPVAVATGKVNPFGRKPNYSIENEIFQKPLRISSSVAVLEKPLPKPVKADLLLLPAPNRPVFAPIEEPQLSNYYDEYAQSTKEPFAKYSVIARKKYTQDHKAYTNQKAAEEKIYTTYLRDSLKYANNLAQQQQYLTTLRQTLESAADVNQNITIENYAEQLKSVKKLLDSIANNNFYDSKAKFLSTELDDLKDKHSDFLVLKNTLDTVYLDKKKFKELNLFSQDLHTFLKSIETKVEAAELKKLEEVDAEKYFAQSASYNISRLLAKENWDAKDCEAAERWIKTVRKQYIADFSKIQTKYNLFIRKNTPIITLCQDKYEAIYKTNIDFYNKRRELGFLTANEVAELYRNAMAINTLGWINCDKFTNDPSIRNQIDILTQDAKGDNTQFFIVFNDIKSVMSANPVGTNLFRSLSLPENRFVTVIGIRIQDQQAEISVTKGKVSELKKLNAKFEPKTLKEVYSILETLS